MNFKKMLCLCLALVLAMATMALAEGDDLQAQLDAANARIAELEAQVEKYQPYYESQIVAEFGDGQVIELADAQAQYDEIAAMYAQYGIPLDSYAGEIKENILTSMVTRAVLDRKAEELGLTNLDEQTMADLNDKAAEDMQTYIEYYSSYFATEGASDEENRQATIDGLAQHNISQENMLRDRIENYVSEQLTEYITKDVTVSDEDVQAKYDAMVAEAEESYGEDDFSYNSARSGSDPIAWNPEGYRAVKHVLVKFSDEQAKQYEELNDALESLNDELAALDEAEAEPAGETEEEAAGETEEEPAEETEEEPADKTEEATGEAGAEEEAEEVEPPRSREEIETDIGAVGASIEALYAELLPRAQEVVDAFNAGEDFDSLIEKYGEDPGMKEEPTASQGYAVSAGSTTWDPAFTEGAMSIAEVGQISEPVRGMNGIHIIYYMSDITPGPVPFEDIRDAVAQAALEDKKDECYTETTEAWVSDANPVYHLDRFN